jgi:conjugative relaxase-like TrwC/TraI family protein
MAEHRSGWDLTFSAPKSVSVYWGLSDPATRRKVESAQLQAVRAAVSYLELYAAQTRRGKGGKTTEPAKLIVAAFEHGTSRALDPQLHTHTLVLNVCVRPDGTTGSVNSPPLFHHKMATGAIYRAELQSALHEQLGLATKTRDGFFELVSVPSEAAEVFSKRRKEILDRLQDGHSAKQAAVAALESRGVKESVPRDQLFELWKNEAKLAHISLLGQDPKEERRAVDFDLPEVADLPSLARIEAERAIFQLQGATSAVQSIERILAESIRVGETRLLAPNAYTAGIPSEEMHRLANSIGIAPDLARCKLLAQSGDDIDWLTPKEFLRRYADEKTDILALMDGLKPNIAEPLIRFLHQYGPDIAAPVRWKGPNLGELAKFGPDVTEAFRSLATNLFGEGSVLSGGHVLIDSPERIRSRELFQIIAAAHSFGASVKVVRQAEETRIQNSAHNQQTHGHR